MGNRLEIVMRQFRFKGHLIIRVFITLIAVLFYQFIIPVSASPTILDQSYHTGVSEIYTNDEIESSIWTEAGFTYRLSRVLLKDKVGLSCKVLADVESVAAKTSSVAQGTNTVYHGLDAAGNVRHVGITNRAQAVRFAEHIGSGTNKALLRYEAIPGASNLSRTGAGVWEQRLINQYGLRRNGGQLFNRINSISPSKWHLNGIR